MDEQHSKHWPWVTWILSAFIIFVSVMAMPNLQGSIERYGLVPAKFGRYGGLTFLTSVVLHGGIFHLLSNMYFFLVFGDNVEEWLGRFHFTFLLLTAAIVGGIFHILSDPSSMTPCVGASGAISGVLAFYALKFPHAKLGIFLNFKWLHFPASWMFLFWVAMQLLGTYKQIFHASHVSALAHLGGACVGFVFWLVTRAK